MKDKTITMGDQAYIVIHNTSIWSPTDGRASVPPIILKEAKLGRGRCALVICDGVVDVECGTNECAEVFTCLRGDVKMTCIIGPVDVGFKN